MATSIAARPTPSQHEARHDVRVPLELRVHVKMHDGCDILLLSHDWSRVAVFLRTHHPLPLGTKTALSIVVPGERLPVAFAGVVERVVPDGSTDGNRPPGMVIHFIELPSPLRKHLSALAAKDRLMRRPQDPAAPPKKVPALLLLGGLPLNRMKFASFLEANGFQVTNADSQDEAFTSLVEGLKPRVVVVLEDGAALAALEQRIVAARLQAMPEVAVIIGAMPEGFAGGVEHPVIALPRSTSAETLLAHLKGELAVPHQEMPPEPPHE